MSDPESPSRNVLPGRTTPTWEVELLISGAVVIALIQLLTPLEETFAQLMPGIPARLEAAGVYAYLYSKVALYILIATFVLHIAARAAWVALVGVHSIYPKGPRWDRMQGGPIGRRIAEEMGGDVDAAIERADNRATLVFGYGILAAQFILVILVSTLVIIGVAQLVTLVLPTRDSLLIAFAVVLLPLVLAGMLDWMLGKRLRPGSFAYRVIEQTLRASQWLVLKQFTQPLLSLITTNIGGRIGAWVLVGVVYLALAVTALDTVIRLDHFDPFRGNAMPELRRDNAVLPSHYGNLRSDELRSSVSPYIPSEVVRGPYLKLVVPYVSDRHDQLLAERCVMPPERAKGEAERAARRAAEEAFMACFGALLDIRLDGKPIPGLQLEAFEDPRSGHRAGLAMIDLRSLPRGRHELTIARHPRVGRAFGGDEPEPDELIPYHIPFWR